MSDENDGVSEFVSVTNSDVDTAKFYLESCNGDIAAAIESYFTNTDQASAILHQVDNDSGGVESTPVAPTRPPAPTSRIAGLGDMMNEVKEDEEDSEDDKPQGNEYYAGGQNSGVAIQGGNNSDTVGNLFESARRHGAVQGTESDLGPGSGMRAFSGRSHVLSGGTTAPPEPASNEELHVTIAFYTNGIFTVNDGEGRSVEDPANAEFLDCIRQGICPPELVSRTGQPLKVNLVRKGEEYQAPKQPKYSAFTGTSQTLTDGGPSSHPVRLDPVPPGEWEGADETKPTTSIQIRLSDGSRVVARFNHSHTVRDIRRFVAALRPEVAHTGPLLTGYPSKPLSDEDQSIEQAGLINAVVILR